MPMTSGTETQTKSKSDETEVEVKGIIEASFLDWDGKLVTTLFLPGCNFACPFCQNWELLKEPNSFSTIPFTELADFLRNNKQFLDGVCITGGEPTVHKALPRFIKRIKKLGFAVKLDTNGAKPDVLKALIDAGLIDYVAMDIKAPLTSARYNKLAGVVVDLNKVRRTIELLMSARIDYEFRTTLVPTLLSERDVLRISEAIKGARKYVLQQFIPRLAMQPELRALKRYDLEKIAQMARAARKYVKDTSIRG